MTTTLQANENEQYSRLFSISLTDGLFVLILAIAATLRLGSLGVLPLAGDEAAHALAVWRYWQPPEAQPAVTALSPAYFSLTAGVFALLGDGDVTARLAPVAFGLLTVALPWLWRERLGTAGALAVSALLAVSPTMTMVSVTAGGDAMAVAALVILFIAWMRFRAGGEERWLALATAALGFGLATAPLFYSGLLTLAVTWIVQRAVGMADAESGWGDGVGIAASRTRWLLLLAATVFIVIATFFLGRPAGVGDATAQLAQWLGQFDVLGGIRALALPLLALGRYELVVAILGAGAIVWASWRGYSLPVLLVYWFAAALVLTLLQQGALSNVLILVLPSYLLIGLWLNHVLREPASDARWGLVLTLLLLGVIAYFNGARYLRVMTTSPLQLSFLFLAFVAVAAAFVAVNFVRTWDPGAAYQGALVGVLILFLIYNWGTASWMLREGGNDPREYWSKVGADDDLRMLERTLQEVSWQATSSARDLEVLSAVDTAAIRWYLREFPNTIIGSTVPPGATQHAIITPADVEDPALGNDYLGTDMGLAHTGATSSFELPVTLSDTLRWWIFHEHPALVSGERIILWVRSDALE